MAADLYSLLFADEPTAQEQAQSMAQALRRQQAVGLLGQLTGDKVLTGVGQGLQQQAQQGQQQLGQAGAQRLQRTLQAQEQAATMGLHRDQLTETTRHNKADESNARTLAARGLGPRGGIGAGAAAADLTPDAIEIYVDNWARTGKQPNFGRANAQFLPILANRIAEKFPGINLAGAGADYGANSHALTDMTKREATTGAFEATAEKNLDNFLKTAEKVPDWRNQTLNSFVRFLDEKGGSPEMSSFRAAHEAAASEAAKVLSGGLGSGATSDAGKKAAHDMLNPDATIEQLRAAASTLKQDMAARKNSNAEAIEGLRKKTRGENNAGTGGGGTPAKAEATPTTKQVVKKEQNKAKKQTRLTYSDGSTEVVDGLQ